MRKPAARKTSHKPSRAKAANKTAASARPPAKADPAAPLAAPTHGRAASSGFPLPRQCPPADREYLRMLIGRQGKPRPPAKPQEPSAKTDNDPEDDDYFVQLSTFHVRDRRF